MALRPLAWHEQDYVARDGTAEHWHAEFFNGEDYNCSRWIFTDVASMQISQARIKNAAKLLSVDEAASDVENAAAEALYQLVQLTTRERQAAMDFFMDGRDEAKSAAHEMIAEIDNGVGNFKH